MVDLIVRCAIVIAALSPIWRRLYIGHFWVRGRATVIQVNHEFASSDGGIGWVPVPTIEFYADGQRWEFPKSHFPPPGEGPDSKYRVGDQFDILYNPRKPGRWTLDAWSYWIWAATLTGAYGIVFAPAISDAWSNWIWGATLTGALGMIFAPLISS